MRLIGCRIRTTATIASRLTNHRVIRRSLEPDLGELAFAAPSFSAISSSTGERFFFGARLAGLPDFGLLRDFWANCIRSLEEERTG